MSDGVYLPLGGLYANKGNKQKKINECPVLCNLICSDLGLCY